jgi:hypothetical protein
VKPEVQFFFTPLPELRINILCIQSASWIEWNYRKRKPTADGGERRSCSMKKIITNMTALLGAILLIYLFAYIFIGEEVLALGEKDPLAPTPKTTQVFMQYFQGTLTANPDPIDPLTLEFNGRYSRGDFFSGESIFINTDGSFEYYWGSDIGSTEMRGFIDVFNGKFSLIPFNPNIKSELDYHMENYSPLIPVLWGERRYMVPEFEIVQFCNHVNGGYEPSDSFNQYTFLNTEDQDNPTGGRDEFPKEIGWCILHEQVIGLVTAKENGHYVLNIGSNQGVFIEMRLYLSGPYSSVLEIDSVSEIQSSGTAEGVHCGTIQVGISEFSSTR